VLDALPAPEPPRHRGLELSQKGVDQRRFADASLAREEEQLARAMLRPAPAGMELGEFGLTAYTQKRGTGARGGVDGGQSFLLGPYLPHPSEPVPAHPRERTVSPRA